MVVLHSDEEDVKPDLALLESYTCGKVQGHHQSETVQSYNTFGSSIDDKVAAFLTELSPVNCPICHKGIMEKDYQNHMLKHM